LTIFSIVPSFCPSQHRLKPFGGGDKKTNSLTAGTNIRDNTGIAGIIGITDT